MSRVCNRNSLMIIDRLAIDPSSETFSYISMLRKGEPWLSAEKGIEIFIKDKLLSFMKDSVCLFTASIRTNYTALLDGTVVSDSVEHSKKSVGKAAESLQTRGRRIRGKEKK